MVNCDAFERKPICMKKLAVFSLFLLTACGSAAGGDTRSSPAKPMSTKQSATAAAGASAFAVGVNVAGIQWGNRTFMNLIYGSSWQMRDTSGGYADIPPTDLDGNGWVKSLPNGYQVIRGLSAPYSGGNFVCRYEGDGTLGVSGAAVSNVTKSTGVTRFTLGTTYPNPQGAALSYTVDPTNYIRNIDCREANGSATDTLAPEF